MKAQSLIISTILILGFTSCTKEDAITPASDSSSLVDQRMAIAQNIYNPFKGKEFVVMAFIQDKADKPEMKRITLKFKDSGLLEVRGQNLNVKASWSYSSGAMTRTSSNKLMIRSDGKNTLVNHLSSDVWEITEMGNGLIHVKAVHYEMVKEIDIQDINIGPVSPEPSPI